MITGNQTYYIIAKQPAFGTAPTSLTGAMVFNQKCDIKVNPNMIERPIKSQTFEKLYCQTSLGSKEVAIDMSGVLCSEYQTLLQAYFNKATSVYSIGTSSTADSYTVIRYYPGTTPKVEYATGCSLNQLNITGTSRQNINFSANWAGKEFNEYQSTGSFTNIPANICGTPFTMNSCSFSGGTGSLTLSDFSIGLTTQMTDDKYRYQISASVINNDFTSKGCSFNYTTIFDGDLDKQMNSYLGQMINTYTLTLNNPSKHWQFDLCGKLEDYSKPDPDKGTYQQQATINTYFSGSSGGIAVTIS